VRAARLLSILILLQTRGRLTARRLARELEVSERTIYRDLDALSGAGVPVYAERGPGGGCALLESYRTNLTGLTEGEVRALFMLSIPAPLSDLGMGEELKAALLKLTAALPEARRPDEELVRQRIHLDPTGWSHPGGPLPHLQTIQRALWDDRRLRLTYSLEFGAHADRLVDPYGLVAKAGVWHLVCAADRRVRVYRVSRVIEAHVTDEPCRRPPDFDLAAFWRDWCAGLAAHRPSYPVTVRVAPALFPLLRRRFGEEIERASGAEVRTADAEGWLTLVLPFETLPEARECILGCGGAAEVLEPEALRLSVIDFAGQTAAVYRRRSR
jgi:predicted DNA-binding transcriptional regulator YafY